MRVGLRRVGKWVLMLFLVLLVVALIYIGTLAFPSPLFAYGARDLWKWQLLVEFLGEVKGYTLADLVKEDVTERSTWEQMMAWYRIRLRPTE